MPTVLISAPFDAYGGNEPYVFVSYAHIDAAAVYPEIKKMHQNGVRIWYDKGIEEGNEWPAEIEKALNSCTVFIVFLSNHAVESVNIRNEIHLALKKKKEFLAIYLEKTDLKFGLELTISSLQHVTKRQTGEYWERIWKFLTTRPQVFESAKSQNVFTSANQNLVFNIDALGLVDKHQNQKSVFPKFTNKQKYFGLGVISLLAMGIFAIAALLFFGDKTSKAEKPQPPITTDNSVAKKKQDESAKSLGKKVLEVEDLGKGVSLEMVLIPAENFMMGSPASEFSRDDDEKQHEVTLMKPFYMGKNEVTQEQWEAMGGDNSSFFKGARFPVTNVSWNGCQEFIKKLNAKTDGGYRLPTEAEWEYACRAGTTTAYSYGDSLTKNDANIDGGSTKEVWSYKPNAFGLYDMHGNVWEWCEDWYGDYPEETVTDPKGPETGTKRVMRGGSFYRNESIARSSDRDHGEPSFRNYGIGFRLARTP